LKKRTKKLLSYKGMALRQGARIRKSFCFFFQKEVLSDFGSINVNTVGIIGPPHRAGFLIHRGSPSYDCPGSRKAFAAGNVVVSAQQRIARAV